MSKIIMIALIFAASSAYGMVFKWTDSSGITHYTNKEYEIPARYRAKVKSLYPDAADMAAPGQSGQTPTATPAQPAPPAPPVAQPVPQAKPDEQPKPQQPAATPEIRKSSPEPPVKRSRRGRSSRSSEEE